MARKMLFAEQYQGLKLDRPNIFIDQYLDIDMTVAFDPIGTEEKGRPMVSKPTYAVWARPRNVYFDPHGHIVKIDDIRWLENTPRGYHEKFICRVNQLNVFDQETEKNGFLLEVTSGLESRQIARAENYDQLAAFAKNHWWQIGVGIAIGWWWFF